MKLLSVGSDAKTKKGEERGYLTGILYLAPAKLSGYEVCPQRSPGCTSGCLNTAGQGKFSNVQAARIAKTKRYFEDRCAFMVDLLEDIGRLRNKASKRGLKPCVRLNGTSDIPWERVSVADACSVILTHKPRSPIRAVLENFWDYNARYPKNIFELFPFIPFYDYTKVTKRALAATPRGSDPDWPTNYIITFSRTEGNDEDCAKVFDSGGNVSVVLRHNSIPSASTVVPFKFGPVACVDGDKDDLRFLDPTPSVVLLKAKGAARKDTSGFVI